MDYSNVKISTNLDTTILSVTEVYQLSLIF